MHFLRAVEDRLAAEFAGAATAEARRALPEADQLTRGGRLTNACCLPSFNWRPETSVSSATSRPQPSETGGTSSTGLNNLSSGTNREVGKN